MSAPEIGTPGRRPWRALWRCAALLLVTASAASGERLPLHRYSTADGLASGFIQRIVRDSRGFLWFGTRDGLSRFDGRHFVTYTVQDGLPDATVNDIIETRGGEYWIGTNGGGVCRLDPGARAQGGIGAGTRAPGAQKHTFCVAVRLGEDRLSNRVNVIYEDRSGRLWVGADGGLFMLEASADAPRFARVETHLRRQPRAGVSSFAEDGQGSLWIGTEEGLLRRLPDGRFLQYTVDGSDQRDVLRELLADASGRLWIGHENGLWRLTPDPAAALADASELEGIPIQRAGRLERYTEKDGWPGGEVYALHQAPDGRIWMGAFASLVEFDGERLRQYTSRHGLPGTTITALATDAGGNLWAGSPGGALRLAAPGLTTYDQADGLGHDFIHSIFEDTAKNVVAVSGAWFVNRLEGERFVAAQVRVPAGGVPPWRSQAAFLDRGGNWWFLTRSGLYAAPRVSRIEELSHHDLRLHYRGPQSPVQVFRLFEDSKGHLWAGMSSGAGGMLARWDRVSDAPHVFGESEGLSLTAAPLVFSEDRAGNLWIGSDHLAQYTASRFRAFQEAEGLPAGALTALHVDRGGRLWIGTNQGGLARVDHPEVEPLHARVYSLENGLSSSNVRAIVEDALGRIYVGTARGVDRLDPETGRIRRFTTAEGLADDFVTTAFRDSRGDLWFGTYRGLSRLRPAADSPAPPPPVWVSSVRVGGTPLPVGTLGDSELAGLVLSPNDNQIQIEFFGLSFATGGALRFQYVLEGAEQEWSEPTEQPAVIYARLAPGAYRFVVRAVGTDGTPSLRPASVAFRVLPPVWQRGWFLTLAGALALLLAYTGHRYRVGRLLDIERVRTRIATDLHDDIGASLSQIAILSEVARRRSATEGAVAESLAVIAETSRELVDSMSDIVWATNPRGDRLQNLAGRMRRFASDFLTARNIEFHFTAPPPDHDLVIGADERRQVYLIFKEAIHNAARHSGCTQVQASLRDAAGWLTLEVADNGRGFDPDEAEGGHGLSSMRRRAAALRGELEIESRGGSGAVLRLRVPARR